MAADQPRRIQSHIHETSSDSIGLPPPQARVKKRFYSRKRTIARAQQLQEKLDTIPNVRGPSRVSEVREDDEIEGGGSLRSPSHETRQPPKRRRLAWVPDPPSSPEVGALAKRGSIIPSGKRPIPRRQIPWVDGSSSPPAEDSNASPDEPHTSIEEVLPEERQPSLAQDNPLSDLSTRPTGSDRQSMICDWATPTAPASATSQSRSRVNNPQTHHPLHSRLSYISRHQECPQPHTSSTSERAADIPREPRRLERESGTRSSMAPRSTHRNQIITASSSYIPSSPPRHRSLSRTMSTIETSAASSEADNTARQHQLPPEVTEIGGVDLSYTVKARKGRRHWDLLDRGPLTQPDQSFWRARQEREEEVLREMRDNPRPTRKRARPRSEGPDRRRRPTPWSAAENQRLMTLWMEHGNSWALIKDIDDSSPQRMLGIRTQVDLKDRLRTVKSWMLRNGVRLPAQFGQVTLAVNEMQHIANLLAGR